MEGKEKTDGCGAVGKMLPAGVSIGSIPKTFFCTIATRPYLSTKLTGEFCDI